MTQNYGTVPNENDVKEYDERAYWRKWIGEKIESKPMHCAILWLTILDTSFVLLEIIIELFHLEEEGEVLYWTFTIARWISTSITCVFLVEVLFTFLAFGPRYYMPGNSHWIMHIFDALVVITTFVLDMFLKGKEREVAGLFIIFRLWRIIKIMEAVAMSVSFSETTALDQEKQHTKHLENLLEQERAKSQQLEKEIERLKAEISKII